MEDEAVRQRYLTAIRDTHEWFWVSDFQHLVIVWNEVTERPYAVQTGG